MLIISACLNDTIDKYVVSSDDWQLLGIVAPIGIAILLSN
jgi:hypothetical protein